MLAETNIFKQCEFVFNDPLLTGQSCKKPIACHSVIVYSVSKLIKGLVRLFKNIILISLKKKKKLKKFQTISLTISCCAFKLTFNANALLVCRLSTSSTAVRYL